MTFGYSLVFGDDHGGLIGDFTSFAGLEHLYGDDGGAGTPLVGTIPAILFVAFQSGFAMVTVALIAGAVADRMRFASWILFATAWSIFVYLPVAHWVFSAPGLTDEHGGWIVSHLKGDRLRRRYSRRDQFRCFGFGSRAVDRTAPRLAGIRCGRTICLYVMLGAGLLWFGWFGFNAGSALAADGSAALIAVNTLGAGAASMVAWLVVRTDPARTSDVVRRRFRCGGRTRRHHAVVLGGHALGALAVGIAAGAISCLAIELKFRWRYDDSLDVVGVPLVSGVVGTLMIGLVASGSGAGVDGLFWRRPRPALAAGRGVVAVMAYAMAVTAILAFAIDRTIGLRADRQHEADGIDDGSTRNRPTTSRFLK